MKDIGIFKGSARSARLALRWTLFGAMALAPLGARAEQAATAPAAAVKAEKPSSYTQQQHVVYHPDVDGIALVMDIFAPKENANGLAIVAVASGSWFSDYGKVTMLGQGGMYQIGCEHGYTVFAVRPGSVSKFTGFEMERHVKRAIRWIKFHAADYKIDPTRIGLTGASAGGHLASLVALNPDDGDPQAKDPIDRMDCRVKAASVFFPPTDFPNWPMAKGLSTARMKGLFFVRDEEDNLTEEARMETLRKLSPVYYVTENAPPFLIFHGTKDPIVPQKQSELLLAALQEKGVEAKLIYKEGGGHPWPTISEEVAIAADWLDAHLKTEAPAAVGGN